MSAASPKDKNRRCADPSLHAVDDGSDRVEGGVRGDFAVAMARGDLATARRLARRFAGLDTRHETGSLDARLWETCAAYELVLPAVDGRTLLRRETRVAFDHSGPAIALLTLHAWAKTRRVAHRFAEARIGELSCEYVIADHAPAFDPTLVARMRRWLVEHHVPLPGMAPAELPARSRPPAA